MTFDYDVCMKRDGGKAMWDGVEVKVVGKLTHREGSSWYPLNRDGAYRCAPEDELNNLDPPKPELPKRDVVWWRDMEGRVRVATSEGQPPFKGELRRITVRPDALTPDELAEHGVKIEYCHMNDEALRWRVSKWTHGQLLDCYRTHADACHAATDWLREQGKIK